MKTKLRDDTWAMDVVHDQFAAGRKIRALTMRRDGASAGLPGAGLRLFACPHAGGWHGRHRHPRVGGRSVVGRGDPASDCQPSACADWVRA